MATRDKNKGGSPRKNDDSSIGNKQRTSQTGGQSSGGSMRHNKEDAFTKDLNKSGRKKPNR